MNLQGVDVSAYQPKIDWAAVKQSGQVQFAYAKATEGLGYTDAEFADNHDDCKLRGIPFGAYHFLRFGHDGTQQAEHFLSATNGRLGGLIPFVDVEGGGQDGVTDLGALIKTLADFNTRVEQQIGKRIIIYSDYGDWNGMMGGTAAFSGHRFFVAEYNRQSAPSLPNGFSDWVLWQYSDAGQIPGIPGNVDRDRLNGPDLGIIRL